MSYLPVEIEYLVKARNKACNAINNLAPAYMAKAKEFIGKKIIKANGEFMKSFEAIAPPYDSNGVRILIRKSYRSLYLEGTASSQDGSGISHYQAASYWIGDFNEQGYLIKFNEAPFEFVAYDAEKLRADNTELEKLNEAHRLATSEVTHRNGLYVFLR